MVNSQIIIQLFFLVYQIVLKILYLQKILKPLNWEGNLIVL